MDSNRTQNNYPDLVIYPFSQTNTNATEIDGRFYMEAPNMVKLIKAQHDMLIDIRLLVLNILVQRPFDAVIQHDVEAIEKRLSKG